MTCHLVSKVRAVWLLVSGGVADERIATWAEGWEKMQSSKYNLPPSVKGHSWLLERGGVVGGAYYDTIQRTLFRGTIVMKIAQTSVSAYNDFICSYQKIYIKWQFTAI